MLWDAKPSLSQRSNFVLVRASRRGNPFTHVEANGSQPDDRSHRTGVITSANQHPFRATIDRIKGRSAPEVSRMVALPLQRTPAPA